MKKIEIVKNIALIVLFFTTMLFLYSFWVNPIDRPLNISGLIGRSELEIPSFESVTAPQQVILNSGKGTFSIIEENRNEKWEKFIKSITDTENQIESIDEISNLQYEMIMEFKSIIVEFNYDIPVEALIKKYNMQEYSYLDQLGEFTTMAFSSGSQESIFVYSKSKNKYHRIIFENPLVELNEEIKEIAKRTDYDYYKIGQVIGIDNDTIVPISGTFSSSGLIYEHEFSNVDDEGKKEFAKDFFGESLDFVRQIKGSQGSLTFMYGYGEKVLSIHSSGRVDFRNNETPQGSQQTYLEALESALKFVAYHGGWKTEKGIEMQPYVRQVVAVERNKQKGFNIIFGFNLGKDALCQKEGPFLAVEVINGEVTRYQRDMITIDEDHYYENVFTNEKEIYSIINGIAANYKAVAETLKDRGFNFDNYQGEEIFAAISEEITNVKAAYMKQDHGNGINFLKPVWAVDIGQAYIFFDLFTGEFLGASDI